MSSENDSSDNESGPDHIDFNFESLEEEVPIVDYSDDTCPAVKNAKNLQEEAALFLSKIKEFCGTSQATVNAVVDGVNGLIKSYNKVMLAQVCGLSNTDSIEKNEIKELFATLDQQTIFEGVQTSYRKRQYEKSKWKEYVHPECVVTSWKRVVLHGNVKEVPEKFGYYISFLDQLEAVLQCKDILNCIDNPRPACSNMFTSALDGYQYLNHPILTEDPHAIAIILYVDDVKPIESLSTYQGHEIRNYTWTIANIYPELRSSIKSIFLLAMAKSSEAKQDNKPYLSNFIQGVNSLSSREGVTLLINGKHRVFHGFLLFVIGDYPAQGNLGGFKESSSLAYRPCRQCMITHNDLSNKFLESDVTLRSQETHKVHVAAVQCNPEDLQEMRIDEEDPGLEDKPSVKYGVNRRSPLLDLCHFDVTKCLPQDIMHIFMEGILETGCRLLLDHAVSEKRLLLKDVNEFLQNHSYGHLQSDQPSQIESKHLKSGLRQTSSQMLILCSLLPFIVRGRCDKEKLHNFIQLLMIFGMCLSRVIEFHDIEILKELIRKYLTQFKSLYPEKFVSKHHFLIHLPSQIIMFGPLPEQWAMRFEAFHAQYKKLFKVLHNSKNLLFSLITRITNKRSLELRVTANNYLTSDVFCGKFEADKIKLSSFPFKESIIASVHGLSPESDVSTMKKLKWFGTIFHTVGVYPCVILADWKPHEEPTFAAVVRICKIENKYVLVYKHLETVSFWPELNAYEVKFRNVDCFGAMDITKYVFLVPLLFARIDYADYVIFRQNSKPELHKLQQLRG